MTIGQVQVVDQNFDIPMIKLISRVHREILGLAERHQYSRERERYAKIYMRDNEALR